MERGRPCFPPDSSGPVVLALSVPRGEPSPTGLSPSLAAPPRVLRLASPLLTRWRVGRLSQQGASTPTPLWPTAHSAEQVWAPPVSLATTPGISGDFCAGGTPMFRFPPAPATPVAGEVFPHRVSPFGHLRLPGCSAPPRSFSQPDRVLPRLHGARASPVCVGVLRSAHPRSKDLSLTRLSLFTW